MNIRGSGILLHITSLPSPYGIGDLGPSAYRFVDFLADTRQSFWQVLPLNPTNQACGNSPYSIVSAFAGNTNLISPELLLGDGLLSEADLETGVLFSQGSCDYEKAIAFKNRIFDIAYSNFSGDSELKNIYEDFCKKIKSGLMILRYS